MRVSMIAAAGLLGLAAFPAAAQSDAQPYKALGTEPFWSLTIGTRSMRYEAPGTVPVIVGKPKPITGFNGERYVARRMTVDITHVECNDGMSDRTFRDTVTVTMGRKTLRGCGGAILSDGPRTSLLEGDWTIKSLNGRIVSAKTSPSVRFRGSQLSGNASCNNFNGSFRYDRGRLSARPLATTRKFCQQRVQNLQEATILSLFKQPLVVSSNRDGKLVLTAGRGQTMVLAPERPR